MYLSPRNLAKIGQVYLNKGLWNSNKIISKSWIELSSQNFANTNNGGFSDGYGLHWWKYTFTNGISSYECFFAAGWGEQYLYLFPNENISVVITGGYYFDFIEISSHTIVNDYILNSLYN